MSGSGDPQLTYDRLWKAAHQLRARGLREIRGDVVLDRSAFAPVVHDPAQFDGDPRRAYNVGPTRCSPTSRPSTSASSRGTTACACWASRTCPTSRSRAACSWCASRAASWRRNIRYEIEETGLLATVVFTGTFPLDCGEKTLAALACSTATATSRASSAGCGARRAASSSARCAPGRAPVEGQLFYARSPSRSPRSCATSTSSPTT